MAKPFIPSPSQYDTSRAEIARRRQLAEKLMQSDEPTLLGYGGHVAPYHAGTGIGNALKRMSGRHRARQADADLQAVNQQEASEVQQLISSIPAAGQPGREQALMQLVAHPQLGGFAQNMLKEDFKYSSEAEQNRLDRETRKQVAQTYASRPNKQIQYTQPKPPSGYRYTADGQSLEAIPGGPQDPKSSAGQQAQAGKTTESERASKGFYDRMVAAEDILNELPPEAQLGDVNHFLGSDGITGALNRRMMSPEQQQYMQAANDFIRAKLRKESGAVIGDQEMADEYKLYFPMPGDSPEVIQQKAISRQQAMQQLKTGAGRAMPQEQTQSTSETNHNKPTTIRDTIEQEMASNPVLVTTQEEWEALPSGATYTTPNGDTGVK